jgi:hypothetical protein
MEQSSYGVENNDKSESNYVGERNIIIDTFHEYEQRCCGHHNRK